MGFGLIGDMAESVKHSAEDWGNKFKDGGEALGMGIYNDVNRGHTVGEKIARGVFDAGEMWSLPFYAGRKVMSGLVQVLPSGVQDVVDYGHVFSDRRGVGATPDAVWKRGRDSFMGVAMMPFSQFENLVDVAEDGLGVPNRVADQWKVVPLPGIPTVPDNHPNPDRFYQHAAKFGDVNELRRGMMHDKDNQGRIWLPVQQNPKGPVQPKGRFIEKYGHPQIHGGDKFNMIKGFGRRYDNVMRAEKERLDAVKKHRAPHHEGRFTVPDRIAHGRPLSHFLGHDQEHIDRHNTGHAGGKVRKLKVTL